MPVTFSVVVPSLSRPERLRPCLEALSRVDYPRDGFEAIVVVDGGEERPDRRTADVGGDMDLTWLGQPRAGPAAARNRGAAQAQGKYLAFVDDDCAPSAYWLRALEAQFARTPDRLVGGRTLNARPDNAYAAATHALVSYLYSYYNSNPSQPRFFATNNLAVPAELFRAVGAFDTAFGLAGGEDREFCERWLHGGLRLAYAPDAVVYHTHPLTPGEFLRQHFTYGRGAYRYRHASARLKGQRMRLEPPSFYIGLTASAPRLAPLLLASQVANAAGFLWQLMGSTRAFSGRSFRQTNTSTPTARDRSNLPSG